MNKPQTQYLLNYIKRELKEYLHNTVDEHISQVYIEQLNYIIKLIDTVKILGKIK